jgi:hypothetical protein
MWRDTSKIFIEITSSARILLIVTTVIKRSRINIIQTPCIIEIIEIIIIIPFFLILSNNKL